MHRGGQGRTAIAWLLSSDVFPSALSTGTCTGTLAGTRVRDDGCNTVNLLLLFLNHTRYTTKQAWLYYFNYIFKSTVI